MPSSLTLLRGALLLALIASAVYGTWEARRWSTPEARDVISPKQRTLRAWGLFFLLAVLGLWLYGTYLPQPVKGVTIAAKKSQIAWLQYWMVTILASLPLIPLALLDWRENLRHLAESRQTSLHETMGSLAGSPRTGSPSDPPPTTPA